MSNPTTPPPEMVETLRNSAPHQLQAARETWLITHAYAAGAERMLKACCAWLVSKYNITTWADELCAAMSPKPPSLKEQGLEALGPSPGKDHAVMIDHARHQAILAALEALHDDN